MIAVQYHERLWTIEQRVKLTCHHQVKIEADNALDTVLQLPDRIKHAESRIAAIAHAQQFRVLNRQRFAGSVLLVRDADEPMRH
jgi:hypothetical protein